MTETTPIQRAAREAVQPSLWDRVKNDLPGLYAETDTVRAHLETTLGVDRVAELLSGPARVIEADPDLTRDQKRDLHRLLRLADQAAKIEAQGIVVSTAVLREAVRRDIEALFNTERMEAEYMLSDLEAATSTTISDLSAYPHVQKSVVNYGVPAFAGRSSRGIDKDRLAKELREVLAVFEPRLKRDTIKVAVRSEEKLGMVVVIDAVLMTSPAPERLRLRTSIDLESGRALTALDDA